MNTIYANSHLTIAALSSPGGDHGIYTYDASEELKRPSVAVEVELRDGKKTTVYARRTFFDGGFDFIHGREQFRWLTHTPLETRLWTLQEIALSRRVLWFAHGDLGWSCKEATACECLPQPVPISRHKLPAHLSIDLLSNAQVNRPKWLPIWYDYIEQATQRLVTNASDRLPAVAGLAAAMQQHIGGRYAAGHWETDMEKSLLWVIRPDEDFRYDGVAQLDPMDQAYAPSWSWASVSRPMTHLTADLPDILGQGMDCMVLSIDFRPSTENVYGAGIGVLTMEGLLVPVNYPSGASSWARFKHRGETKQLELHAGERAWKPDLRGGSRPVEEMDLYISIHMHWPHGLEADEKGFMSALVLERVSEEEVRKWETRFREHERRVSNGTTAISSSSNVVGNELQCNATGSDVFRRVGCVDILFRLGEYDTWEELVEEYKLQFHII